MIIGLVGEKLAGKDTAANYLAQKYGAAHFRFTHILDAILEELNLPVSRRNEIALGLDLRKVFGPHVLVNAVEYRVRKSLSGMKVVNGIRMDEFDVVKSWDAKIIYITAPAEIRFQRYSNRHEKADDAIFNFQQFLEQEKGPTEIDIPKLGARADHRIDNVGTMPEFCAKIDEVVKKIQGK